VVVATGGVGTSTMIFEASVSDTNNPDTVYLCVEVDTVATSFSNTEDSCGTGVVVSGSSTTASHTIAGLSPGGNYHWQVRVKDAASTYSGWVSYGANLESATDFSVSSNTAPASPTSLVQTKTTTTVIATGAYTNETSVRFTASATDPNNPDTLYLCVERKAIASAFVSDVANETCGTGVAYSGSTVSVVVTISVADATSYHWQARLKDTAGAYSSWVSYGANLETVADFIVDTSAPTGGVVYDGASAGIDKSFNNGSLSILDANWDSFSGAVSGIAKYEYSVGTTAGGVDIKGWTDNLTATSVNVPSLTLQTSKRYYFNVRATDNAGNLGGVVSSNGQLVGPTLGFAISASVTLPRARSANSYDVTAATTLTTSTNGYGGFVTRAFATDLLRSTTNSSVTIPHFSGATYASPGPWATATGFGYNSSDTSVQGGVKFQGDGFGNCPNGSAAEVNKCWAPFATAAPGDIVADHTVAVTGTPITNEQVTLTYRSRTSGTQAAGQYNTLMVFNTTATF